MSCTPLAHAFDSPSLPVPDEQWCHCGMTTWGQMHTVKFVVHSFDNEEDAAYLRGLEAGAKKVENWLQGGEVTGRDGLKELADAIRQRIAEVKGEP